MKILIIPRISDNDQLTTQSSIHVMRRKRSRINYKPLNCLFVRRSISAYPVIVLLVAACMPCVRPIHVFMYVMFFQFKRIRTGLEFR